MAAAVFQVVNLAVVNNALTTEMHGAKHGIVLLTLGTVTVTPQTTQRC